MQASSTDSESPITSANASSLSNGYTVSHKFEDGRRFQDMDIVDYFVPNDDEGTYDYKAV